MTFFPFLQAAPAGGSSTLMTILPFGLIILIFYFFIIRPQNKKQKDTEKMISAVKKGDKVITIGGIHGVVATTDEKTIVVKVGDETKIKFNRSAIASVVNDPSSADKKAEPENAEKKSLFGLKKKIEEKSAGAE
ncbi:MAG: preprotein translocase subunit YajC [Treponema sp.]|jgi:preprotein translocase subunit YajC|nr:preprotein translocase subunit YajC [Treponema sp.]